MELKKQSAKRTLIIAIALMLVSMIGASSVQTSGGSVTIKDIRFETDTGYKMSGLLFVPKGVSSENPTPAIVTSHGMFNNREMQDANYVELSRRGYVVFSMDMLSHGNSDNVDFIGNVVTGMYEAVKMLSRLNYVDSSKIGVTGHSLGGMSSNAAVGIDNEMPDQLISAVLLNSADAEYKDPEGNFFNMYGSRDLGIIACQYDEFFMRDVDGNGNMTPPRDYIKYNNAQSVLYFGTDPTGKELRQAETIYRENVDGREAVRVIYNPNIIHPWSHFSKQSTTATVEFFETALGAPNPIPATNQMWQLKELFNLLGLIGVAMFIISFATLMVFTQFFASLRAKQVVEPSHLPKEGKVWFLGSLILLALFGTLIFYPVQGICNSFTMTREIFQQSIVWGNSLWAVICGLFAIICMTVSYNVYWKKKGFNLVERGVIMPFRHIGKTILLALLVISVSYGWVFFADFFFKTDFRIWILAMKAFEADKIFVAIFPYAAFFLIFYTALSVAANSFNYNDFGKKSWINTFIVVLFTALPPVVLLLLQYGVFKGTGFMFLNAEPYNMTTMGLFPATVFLSVATIISRKIYLVTNNPYLPGIINGLIVAMMCCSNSLTWL